VFGVEGAAPSEISGPAVAVSYQVPIVFWDAWWGDSIGGRAYYVDRERGAKAFRLMMIDRVSAQARPIAVERGPTMVEAAHGIGTKPNLHVTENGAEIMFSERDGWAHLYLLDGVTATVKHQITKGPWVVRELVRVDEKARKIWFTAGGREPERDPYYRHLYSIDFAGSNLTLLTPEDAEHEITLSPSGSWVVDRFSRVDLAPTTVVRSLDGKTVLPLERANLTRLLDTGWRFPERFVTKAADGTTDIYGVIQTPSTFDSTIRYPVVEEIYPGPQNIHVPKAFQAGGDLQALVELGMVGIIIDGRGTPFRAKAFHDYSHGRLENGGGLEDHLAAYRQLGASRRYLDLDRVGIYGHSAGGFASARAIFLYPDFYKVAVSSAGNHDQRGNIAIWGETYQGMPSGDNYRSQANASIAASLKGKLLLAFGDMDDNVPPALTFQVIDALIAANNDYDLLVVTNGSHTMYTNPYFRRRRWDYFVEHLMGFKPPDRYRIVTPADTPY
jgi:dipeptidyl aminopeptidase/acylaminoacyl peptidase